MDRARIVLFDDQPSITVSLTRLLEYEGHEVVRIVQSVPEALDYVGTTSESFDVAVIDGNLRYTNSADDGQMIVNAFRERSELRHVKLISNSASHRLVNVDAVANKVASVLLDIIRDLP